MTAPRPERVRMCEAVSARGYFCTLREGHEGVHFARVHNADAVGGPIGYAWQEIPAPAPSE